MFYDLFYELCVRKGVTPSKACLEMGLSRALAAKWKNTKATPSADTMSKISDYFGVSTDYLLGKEEQKEKPLINGDEELTEYLEELRTRVQALLRKGGDPLQQKGLSNLLSEVEQAGRALETGGEGGFSTKDLSTLYSAVYAQRRRIDQFLDTAMCPADKRDELISAASAVNALLRRLRADLEERGADAEGAAKKGTIAP